MKLLLFTRALACAQHAHFDKTKPTQALALARMSRADRVPRLRCAWSRDADGRLACRWLHDDTTDDDGTIPLAAIRRFPHSPAPSPMHAPLRTPTQTRVTDLRRRGDNIPTPMHDNRFPPGHAPRPSMSNSHVRHVRPA
jgi:hypothetical protein